jgi:transcription-repair coupling factor (superfamily II helicase)
VLVSTTIIESGIDIPQANTLVVERSDTLGLAQLYQIRGRVGRSDATAYAYLFYPDARELTPEARARLATLADHTELGAGFAIAMRDLEIRGAGELLGAEQSGHVAAVGFELYVELLNEAVAELQGQKRIAARPVRVDARVDAYVPAAYVDSEALRIDIHRRLALAETEDELRELQASLEDRYWPAAGAVVENPSGSRRRRSRSRCSAPTTSSSRAGRRRWAGSCSARASCGSCATGRKPPSTSRLSRR